jgi:hypothetical protein
MKLWMRDALSQHPRKYSQCYFLQVAHTFKVSKMPRGFIYHTRIAVFKTEYNFEIKQLHYQVQALES